MTISSVTLDTLQAQVTKLEKAITNLSLAVAEVKLSNDQTSKQVVELTDSRDQLIAMLDAGADKLESIARVKSRDTITAMAD